MSIEAELSEALRRQAERTTVSPDARSRIEGRVRRTSSPSQARRSFQVAAAMLVVVGTLAAVSTVRTARNADGRTTALPPIEPARPNRDAPLIGLRMKGACGTWLCDAGVVAETNFMFREGTTRVVIDGHFKDVSRVGSEFWAVDDNRPQVVRPRPDGSNEIVPEFRNDRAVSAPIELADGRLVVALSVSVAGSLAFDLIIHDRASGARVDLLHGERSLSNPVIGPGGQIGVIAGLGDGEGAFRTFTAEGRPLSVVRLPREVMRAGFMERRVSWSRLGLLAISNFMIGVGPDDETWIVDPVSGDVVNHIEGWSGQAWSPDGTALMLARRGKGARTELAMGYGQRVDELAYAHGFGSSTDDYFMPLLWLPSDQ